MTAGERFVRAIVAVFGGAVAAIAGWVLFVRVPGSLADLLGVVLALGVAVTGLRLAAGAAGSLLPSHNVAEVAVEGPITRDGGGSPLSRAPIGAAADDVVDAIKRADEDRGAEALLVKLNTPGGEIVPSEDIRLAAERFDGPTVAYATDVCASGGYDIAVGCDELWARGGSIVGSIGVRGSRINVADLADRLGVSYEQLAAGEYKEAGTPFAELDDDERAYLQGIVDDYYDRFVAQVAEGRGMDPETVRDTEARVYLGEEALDRGLVDAVGTREDVLERVEGMLGEEATVRAFEPSRGLTDRLRGGVYGAAYAVGAGVADVVGGGDEVGLPR